MRSVFIVEPAADLPARYIGFEAWTGAPSPGVDCPLIAVVLRTVVLEAFYPPF